LPLTLFQLSKKTVQLGNVPSLFPYNIVDPLKAILWRHDILYAEVKQDRFFLKVMDEYDLLMIEQPLAYDNLVDHASLQAQIKTSLCLDESIANPASARSAIALNASQIINIKQSRVGGLLQAKKAYNIAGRCNKGVWCGGMLETGIGRAVNVVLASLQNFNYPSDISASSRYWERDISDSEFMINSDGTLDVPAGPGLGVEINEKILNRLVLRRETIRL
jgi:O-succinylbenzoate synthase